ncbi:hypothetical protein [Pseudomonas aeruginosa]|uniref:hypothetical protein n=1 Tax=Pseudomonas aeruginosa TaxID=287 RepID=UPI0021BD5D52|nr:hypothetical protein [Pseudomonas aeruginosa]
MTGAGDTVGRHPALPVTPKQIAAAPLDAAPAGPPRARGRARASRYSARRPLAGRKPPSGSSA